MSRAEQGIIESEWVYTGPAFARSHPIAQHLGAVWLVVLWVALQLVGASNMLVEMIGRTLDGQGFWTALLVLLLFILIMNNFLALWGLMTRNTVAWYPVWVSLICGVLLVSPLMIYWASGQRPNLIYRHRFGRLVWPAQDAPS